MAVPSWPNNIKQLCLACFKNNKSINVFDYNYNGEKLVKIIKDCTGILFEENVLTIPTTLCEDCVAILKMLHNFIFMCRRNEKNMREFLTCSNPANKSDLTGLSEDAQTKDLENEEKLLHILHYVEADHDYIIKSIENQESEINNQIIIENMPEAESDLKVWSKEKHRCKTCGKLFSNKFSLSAHHKYIHESRPFLCSVCGKTFSRLHHLNTHISTLHKDSSENGENATFNCNVCSKSYATLSSLRAHTKIHTKGHPYKCEFCGHYFKSISKRDSHKCPKKLVMQIKGLITTTPEIADSLPTCDVCGKEFTDDNLLFEHRKKMHMEEGGRCDVCKKKFSCHFYLKKHMKLHLKELPFKCSVCGKGCPSQYALDRHTRRHSGADSVTCQHCGKVLSHTSSLKYHLATHEQPKDSVRCDICDKHFASESFLKKHLITHNKPFLCVECGKTFGNKTKYTEHMNRHKGEKPFVCDKCDKAFFYKFCLRRHKEVYHRHSGIDAVEVVN